MIVAIVLFSTVFGPTQSALVTMAGTAAGRVRRALDLSLVGWLRTFTLSGFGYYPLKPFLVT